MKKTMIGLGLLLLLIACDKSDSTDVNNPENIQLEGRYIGTFQRTGMGAANVSILFRDNHFEGYSDVPKYPAICGGSFSRQSTTIQFQDSCSWTADFDWSLILTGTFNYQLTDSTLKIWKNNGTVTDEYNLRKIIRL